MSKLEELLVAIPDSRAKQVLLNLHREAAKQERSLYFEFARFLPDFLLGKNLPWHEISPILNKKYMAVDPSQGVFCYLLARAIGARNIIEFGTSFSVSTIYLAMAVRDNGCGRVISTEIEEEKAKQARINAFLSIMENRYLV